MVIAIDSHQVFIYYLQEYFNYFRYCICNYLILNRKTYSKEYPYIQHNETLLNNFTYIKTFNNNGISAGELEMNINAKLLNLNIIVLEYKQKL